MYEKTTVTKRVAYKKKNVFQIFFSINYAKGSETQSNKLKFVNAIIAAPFNQNFPGKCQLKFEFFYHYNNFHFFFGKVRNKNKNNF